MNARHVPLLGGVGETDETGKWKLVCPLQLQQVRRACHDMDMVWT